MNWGYRLLFTFIAFAGMMGYLVFRAYKTNFELVKPDYYKDELSYQKVIDGANRANTLSASPALSQNGTSVTLQMPEEMRGKAITGNAWFYCAYDSRRDRKLDIQPDGDGKETFAGSFMPGNYTVKLEWNAEGKEYYTEKNMTIR
ncbi:MAG: FixH family protein [Bacteroidetes bacterium]|nr:FixH family protein [Bacteroidota bacterium]MBS1609107.1 FixH family protein [Bacteroidota bacterium]